MRERKQAKRSRRKRVPEVSSHWVRDKHTHRLLFIFGHKGKGVQSPDPPAVSGDAK